MVNKKPSQYFRPFLAMGFVLAPIFIGLLCLCKLFRYKVSIFIVRNRFFGHLAIDTELQLQITSGSLRICALEWPISANLELERIIRHHVHFLPYWIVWPTWRALLSVSNRLKIEFGPIGFLDAYREVKYFHLLANTKRELKLDLNDDLQREVLSELGLESKKYFCIALRDGSYHKERLPRQELEAYRNHNFEKYVPAILDLPELQFVRLGRTSYRKFDLPNLLDYTGDKNQTDVGDLVIISNSLGLVTGGDGISAVAHVLNTPTLYLRFAPWEVFPTFSDRSWIVPALLRDRADNRFLTIRETFACDKGLGFNWPFPAQENLYIHEYSSNEVSCFIEEFATACSDLHNQRGTRISSKDLESEFWDQYFRFLPRRFRDNLPMHSNILASIPSSFLINYLSFLVMDPSKPPSRGFGSGAIKSLQPSGAASNPNTGRQRDRSSSDERSVSGRMRTG